MSPRNTLISCGSSGLARGARPAQRPAPFGWGTCGVMAQAAPPEGCGFRAAGQEAGAMGFAPQARPVGVPRRHPPRRRGPVSAVNAGRQRPRAAKTDARQGQPGSGAGVEATGVFASSPIGAARAWRVLSELCPSSSANLMRCRRAAGHGLERHVRPPLALRRQARAWSGRRCAAPPRDARAAGTAFSTLLPRGPALRGG
jgi:hypothetical protein